MLQNSDCHFMGELVRSILSREKITIYQKDVSFDAPMEELIRIRKELNAIGVNINQITHTAFIRAIHQANEFFNR
jgi:hypothetical protein